MFVHSLGTVASASADEALVRDLAPWVEEVLPLLCRGVIPVDEILDDGKVGERHAPPSPFAQTSECPPAMGRQVLTAATAEGVRTIAGRVKTDVNQVVAELLQKALRRL